MTVQTLEELSYAGLPYTDAYHYACLLYTSVNRDDRNTEKILFGHTCDIETFSVLGENGVDAPGQKADIVAERITFSMKEGRLYSHFFTDGKEEFLLQMPGIFNVSNALSLIHICPEYLEAKRLLKFLDYFLPMSPDGIGQNSIIREFIGGSCFNV